MQAKELRAELRKAIANYMRSEGCGCCSDEYIHKQDEERIAKLLNVPKYEDGSGYNFEKYQAD